MVHRKWMAAALALLLLTGCAPAGGIESPPAQEKSISAAEVVPEGSVSAEWEGSVSSIPEGEVSAPAQPDRDRLLSEHIFSHRGASGYEVEHTFAAYDLALRQGSHHIEQDLVTSGEGTLYVSHDESAERIAGVDRDFRDLTDEQIAALRTGNGEGIHSMAEVFQRYGTDVVYVVELKEGAQQAKAFAALVKEWGMEENVIVQSFSFAALEEMEELLPELPRLYLCRDKESFDRAVQAEGADIVCVHGKLLSEESVKRVHEAGKRFCVYWTQGEEVRRAIELGADCYFTNYPDQALELEREYRTE